MQNNQNSLQDTQNNPIYWHDLEGWNFYFILKFALLWSGYLNFHALYNLVFLSFLLFPISSLFLNRCRNWIAIPIGLALFYHDTWLPNIYSILNQGTSVFDFSWDYINELINRFINWNMLGIGLILLVAYLYLSQWIRVTTFIIMILVWINVFNLQPFDLLKKPNQSNPLPIETKQTTPITTTPAITANNTLPPTNDNLNTYLKQFYAQQKNLHTNFPASLNTNAQPFDIIFFQICSLAWADIDGVQLQSHPIWSKFDIFFNQFNSAASYSGPAAIRLLRASCGQTPHDELYNPASPDCYIMNNLEKLGFTPQLMLDHLGTFGDFLKEVRQYGGLPQVPLMSQTGISEELISFNGQPIYNDAELLNRWLEDRKKSTSPRSATYYNAIVLHDGNRSLTDNKPVPYKPLATQFLDEIDRFFTELEQSGRKAVFVFIPEHGRNLMGDKLEMPGLRDIPSPDITHIPVGIKFFGMKATHQDKPLKINAPSSYLAISELMSRLVNGELFNQSQIDFQALIQNLPQTLEVSENNGITVMEYQNKPYILLKGESTWVPYP